MNHKGFVFDPKKWPQTSDQRLRKTVAAYLKAGRTAASLHIRYDDENAIVLPGAKPKIKKRASKAAKRPEQPQK